MFAVVLLSLAWGGVEAKNPHALGKTVLLRGNVSMPSMGAGSMGGCSPDGPLTASCGQYNATLQWIKNGGRSMHDALSYCNQFGTGQAVKDCGLPRNELFVMSMVPYTLLGYNNTIKAVAASLEQMQLSYFDLIMVHHRAADASAWPRQLCKMKAFPDVPVSPDGKSALWGPPQCALDDPTWLTCQDETWKALIELRNQGKIRAIGVSNWQLRNLQRMKDMGMELPAVNQVEAHIGYVEDDLLDFCIENDIVIQAATPLGRKMPELIKVGGDPTVTAIAKKYNKSPAQVSLRYLLEKGISPIPSAHTDQYQKENLDVFDFSLTSAEVEALSKLSPSCRGSFADGLQKCWADPGTLICIHSNGTRFHCP